MKEWIRRRWFDVRQGYANYVSVVLAFVNFVLIISVKFNSLSLLLLMLTIGPAAGLMAMGIGYFHRIHQLKTDQDSTFEQSRLSAKVSLVYVKMMEGTATKEEIEWVKDLLAGIAT